MKYILIVMVLLATLSIPQIAFSQFTADTLVNHMRETHTILERNIDQTIALIENNNTAEALNLLEGIDIKVNHMNQMFNDLVWQLSNQGH